MLFTLISCRKNYTYDKEFDRNISYVENAPHIYLSNNPITTPIHINDKKEATEFLLYALAQNYINEDCLPSKKLILKSIGIFRQEHLQLLYRMPYIQQDALMIKPSFSIYIII